jgi:arsenate reductase (glutaredoxin)
MITILHNPRCGKSREALKHLTERGIQPSVRLYLQDPLDKEELVALLSLEGIYPEEIVRKKEEPFRLLPFPFAPDNPVFTGVLAENPILLQRPVVFDADSGVIAREPGELDAWLSKRGYI